MTTADSVFHRALSSMLREIFDGPPGQEAYVINPGDPGLLRQLVAQRADFDAMAASTVLSTAAHTAYHLGAIRQILAAVQRDT